MSLTKYESEVRTVANNVNIAYERFADLRNFEAIKQALDNPEVLNKMKEAAGKDADKLDGIKDQIKNVTFTEDTITMGTQMGELTLRIVEREAPKLIKLEGVGTPMPTNLWIQLLPTADYEFKLKVTLGAELNFFIKQMVGKYMQQGADGIANVLAMLAAAR
jgi:hypothetical protein